MTRPLTFQDYRSSEATRGDLLLGVYVHKAQRPIPAEYEVRECLSQVDGSGVGGYCRVGDSG